jgi:hypothetical protein
MAGIEGHIRAEEKLYALEEYAFDSSRLPPKKAMVDEEDLGPGSRGPAHAFGAGVDREGDELDLSAGTTHLYAVERIVDTVESADIDQGAAPGVEALKIHGGEYIKKRPPGEGGYPGRPRRRRLVGLVD